MLSYIKNRMYRVSQPLLARSRNLRPKDWTPNLHPLLIEWAHSGFDIAFVDLIHKLAHSFLSLWRSRVRSDRAR